MQIKAQINPRLTAKNRTRIAFEILGCKISSAAPQVHAIRDDHLAVVAQVGTSAFWGAKRRNEANHVDTRLREAFQIRIATQIDADAVDQQPDPDSATSGLLEPFGDFVAENIAPEHKGGDFQRAFCAVDHAAQRVQRLRTVLVNTESLVGHRVGQTHRHAQLLRAGCRGRWRRGHGSNPPHTARSAFGDDLAAAKCKIQWQRDVGKKHNAQHPGDGRGRVTALVQAVGSGRIDSQSDDNEQAIENFPVPDNQRFDLGYQLSHRVAPAPFHACHGACVT